MPQTSSFSLNFHRDFTKFQVVSRDPSAVSGLPNFRGISGNFMDFKSISWSLRVWGYCKRVS